MKIVFTFLTLFCLVAASVEAEAPTGFSPVYLCHDAEKSAVLKVSPMSDLLVAEKSLGFIVDSKSSELSNQLKGVILELPGAASAVPKFERKEPRVDTKGGVMPPLSPRPIANLAGLFVDSPLIVKEGRIGPRRMAASRLAVEHVLQQVGGRTTEGADALSSELNALVQEWTRKGDDPEIVAHDLAREVSQSGWYRITTVNKPAFVLLVPAVTGQPAKLEMKPAALVLTDQDLRPTGIKINGSDEDETNWYVSWEPGHTEQVWVGAADWFHGASSFESFASCESRKQ